MSCCCSTELGQSGSWERTRGQRTLGSSLPALCKWWSPFPDTQTRDTTALISLLVVCFVIILFFEIFIYYHLAIQSGSMHAHKMQCVNY